MLMSATLPGVRAKAIGHTPVGGEAAAAREAATIGQAVDLGRAAAARDANRLAPFPPFPPLAERCAFTCVLSSRSSAGTSPAAATFANKRCHTPRRDQRL